MHWGSRSGNVKLSLESGYALSADERSSISSQHSSTTQTSHTHPSDSTFHTSDPHPITHETLITLYTSLRQGLTLRTWVLDNLALLAGIDIRRLITFGIIKGFLYRVHRYAIATSLNLPPAPPTSLQSAPPSTASNHAHKDSDTSTLRGHTQPHSQLPNHLHHKPSLASTTNLFTPGAIAERRADEVTRLDSLVSDGVESGLPLVKFLDGMHCFDEICTELGMSEKAVEGKIRGVGEVQVFSR
jgi:hypothetical protein